MQKAAFWGLSKVLTPYVKDLDQSALKISLWNGTGISEGL